MYCTSRFKSIRRQSRPVPVGNLTIGGDHPIRIQSMTTSLTQDVDATVEQSIRLAEAGCEIIRITAPNKQAAQALKDISKKFRAAGFDNPLVADIHFLPSAAMEAVEHVEKVRVNPGNYADKKKFAVLEYTDQAYQEELERLHDSFSPLVKRAKELGRCLRIGTNHGSLSDRIMNRYGDTPLGMVESALEFIRIAEDHHFYDIVLSMKASNPKVMIQAYRLAAQKMAEENMAYPLHLGVTEAGEGEDARIKSAIGIGALLYDGLGDTIRVSLTEDPWYEIPVCQDLARRTEALWQQNENIPGIEQPESINLYEYTRRAITPIGLSKDCKLGPLEPPRVIIPAHHSLTEPTSIVKKVLAAHNTLSDLRIEGLLVQLNHVDEIPGLLEIQKILAPSLGTIVVELNPSLDSIDLEPIEWDSSTSWILCRSFQNHESATLSAWLAFAQSKGLLLAIDADATAIDTFASILTNSDPAHMIYTLSHFSSTTHPVGHYRHLAHTLIRHHLSSPLWIRCMKAAHISHETHFGALLLEASMFAGSLFCDGFGDLLSVETENDLARATTLAYNILQGARMRASKTEYVACPSCGRTLFDLQSTTQKIKARTGHLKGVTIAVMGCIVNGPGEMADADFGYVGGAPNKVNLYVGKTCVKYNIPEANAMDELVSLIQEHGKWQEANYEL